MGKQNVQAEKVYYYANVGKEPASSIPLVNKSPIEYLKDALCNSFYIFPSTADEIEAEITALKSSKVTGPFSIPVTILKSLKSVISFPSMPHS